jgi:cold shock CspA family protein/ribosome-associated translation inhibitor RaiA
MEIHWRGAQAIGKDQREAIETRLLHLAGESGDLIDVRIALEDGNHHRRGGKGARVVCQARGREIVASRDADDTGLALDQALDVFEREVRKLRDLRQIHRGLRPASPPHFGIVDRVLREQGYGFVLTDGGESVYFHRNAVHGGLDFERLDEGQRVALNYEAGNEGLQATTLVPPPPDASAP